MKLKEDLILRRIGSENIIIVPDKDIVDLTEVYTLNDTSAWIWERIQNTDFTIEYIVDIVREHYEVNQEKAINDIQAFINFLKIKELIVES